MRESEKSGSLCILGFDRTNQASHRCSNRLDFQERRFISSLHFYALLFFIEAAFVPICTEKQTRYPVRSPAHLFTHGIKGNSPTAFNTPFLMHMTADKAVRQCTPLGTMMQCILFYKCSHCNTGYSFSSSVTVDFTKLLIFCYYSHSSFPNVRYIPNHSKYYILIFFISANPPNYRTFSSF